MSETKEEGSGADLVEEEHTEVLQKSAEASCELNHLLNLHS